MLKVGRFCVIPYTKARLRTCPSGGSCEACGAGGSGSTCKPEDSHLWTYTGGGILSVVTDYGSSWHHWINQAEMC